MKLLYILSACLALSLAEPEKQERKEIENIEDSEPKTTNIELLRTRADLIPAASSYRRPSHRGRNWNGQQANDYYWVSTNGPQYTSTSTTPVPVIKNEIYYGENGDYKYEYQIADGTSVGEQGYFTDPQKSEESLVKKGWYSFVGADGITYTVTYWADHTGYHAYGSHLPSSGPASVNRPQQGNNEYPSQTSASYPAYTTTTTTTTQRPNYYPSYNQPQQTYNPPQQTYNPPQQTYNPPQQTYNPPQQTYNPPQQTYNPPQPTYTPPQQTYNPPQPTYTPTQQTYYPPQPAYAPAQPTYNQPQQQNYYPNYNV